MRPLVALAVLVTLLAGCAPASSDPSSDPPSDPSLAPGDGDLGDLEGLRFIGIRVDSPVHRLVVGTSVVMVFEAGSLTVDAGCNRLSGPASVEDGRLRLGPLQTTELGCPEERAAQDAWLAEFLLAGPRISGSPGGVRLSDGETTLRLEPDRPRTMDR